MCHYFVMYVSPLALLDMHAHMHNSHTSDLQCVHAHNIKHHISSLDNYQNMGPLYVTFKYPRNSLAYGQENTLESSCKPTHLKIILLHCKSFLEFF
jgi:hypothetical protein